MPADKTPIEKAKKSRGRRRNPAPSVKGSGGYSWGDGKGPVHSRPKRTAAQLGKAKDAKRLNDPGYFTQPMTLGEAQREGQRSAGLQYDPQISQVQLQQRQVPAWFDQYRASLQTPAQVQQTYAPAIAQQQAVAQDTAKTTAGVDPNSSAGQQDALAAKAREALVNLGTGVLSAGQQADTTYFQGRQGVANAAQTGLNTQLGSQLGSLQGQKGAAVSQYVSDARGRERDYGLASQHQAVENKAFNVDTAVKAENIKTDRQKIRQTAKQQRQNRRDKGNEVITSGALAGKTKKWVRDHPNESSQLVTTYNKKSSSSKAKPRFTPEQQAKSNGTLRKAVALVQQGRKLPSGGASGYWTRAYDQLVQDGMDPAIARAAVQLVRHGRVGPNTSKALKQDYGITRYSKGSKRKKPPGTSSGGGGGPHGTGRG